jgi:CheY-like chemotaxis protein
MGIDQRVATIVVADDDPDILSITSRLLRRAGHTTIPATDGMAGWEAVQQHGPDLVVTDVDMPRMTGFELCEAIRGDPAVAHLPVIFISGSLMPGDTRASEVGATTLLRKPFSAQELNNCVAKALQHGHAESSFPSCP